MASHPQDTEKLANAQSEKIFNDWEEYWAKPNPSKLGIVDSGAGTKNDWTTNGKGETGHTEDNAATNSIEENSTEKRRWAFGMRHGERVDLTYGSWVPYCFDSNGTYTRKDLNMPEHLGEREGGVDAYTLDTPLTRLGQLQARLVGEGLRAAGVSISHVYSSVALRSVASAHHMLEGLEADPSVKIKIEPGLFELKNWHLSKNKMPFMTPLELKKAGYNVDLDYKSYCEMNLSVPETLEEFYERNELVMQSAVQSTEAEGGNIMFVGHATTLDILVKSLKRLTNNDKSPANYEISNNLLRIPYCALGAMKAYPWQVVAPPCPPCINSASGRFDWKTLLEI